MISPLAEALLAWYAVHGRTLPWRSNPEPYSILVSEFMLQQTRIDTVLVYFQRWMERFPTIQALAQADEAEVLKTWEGLGYYRRARSLHKTAKIVLEKYQGKLPSSRQELLQLPGVGEYTAGAIASIAFGKDEIAIDGNIRRVIARLIDLELPLRSPQSESQLRSFVIQNLPHGRSGDFNQALMDLGALICTPRSPNCRQCPLANFCLAYQQNHQSIRPVIEKRPAIPHYTVTAAIIQQDGKILLAQRPEKGLLGGLWEFPGGKQKDGESLVECLEREIQEELGISIKVGESFGIYKHTYTHYRVTLHAYFCTITGGEPLPLSASQIRWVFPHEFASFAMGKIDRQIAKKLAP